MHDCINSKKIEKLESMVMGGESNTGLTVMVAELKVVVNNTNKVVSELTESNKNVTTALNAVHDFMKESETRDNVLLSNKAHRRWLIGTMIALAAVIIGGVAIIV